MEPEGYEPKHHEGTGVDEEEQGYESELVSVAEAVEKLGRRGVMADVVLKGWRGIRERLAGEEESGKVLDEGHTVAARDFVQD